MLVHRQRKYLKELFKTSKIRRVSNIKDKSLFFECQLNQSDFKSDRFSTPIKHRIIQSTQLTHAGCMIDRCTIHRSEWCIITTIYHADTISRASSDIEGRAKSASNLLASPCVLIQTAASTCNVSSPKNGRRKGMLVLKISTSTVLTGGSRETVCVICYPQTCSECVRSINDLYCELFPAYNPRILANVTRSLMQRK